ncbi:sensor histidine kinase [Actinophytocola sp.]|uniref:sensor histidine kinase n=1 Tax=Actinophytocola sp. TaxID=1872138 RepID=UPI002ED4D93F
MPTLPFLRNTVRLRLTLLYGSLFLVSGTVLLAVTYLLFRNATEGRGVSGPQGAIVGSATSPPSGERLVGGEPGATQEQLRATADQLRAQADQQRAADLRELLIQSGIALAIMAVLSIVLGWIIAGRALRRLRTITTTAREISATNLHQRLALDGPDDELKQLGDTFDGLLARLEAAFRSQRQFVANASHELRTPLARQLALGQLALDDPAATVESLQAAHKRVLAAGREQARLIEALLTLARGEGGLDRHEPLDLAAVTDQVIVRTDTDVAGLGVHLTASVRSAPTSGDPHLVERMVANLVDNALRYNTDHGTVTITTENAAGQATLTVANTGPIVPATEVDRLFQPFQRLNPSRTRQNGGLGLGLSIVHAIATAHDATVTAQPRQGGGMHITVTFPGTHPESEAGD